MSFKSTRVAVIGLGAIGTALAKALIGSGAEVRVWNRTRSKSIALKKQGAIACDSAVDAISESEFIVVCVSDYPAWNTLSNQHNLRQTLASRIVIQLTTGTLEEVQAHEQWMSQCGAQLIDGSIMCFPSQIGTDDASLLVAGSQITFDLCLDILHTLSPNVTYLDDNINAPVVLGRALISQTLGLIFGTINGAALCQASGISLSPFIKHSRQLNPILASEVVRICEAIESGDTVTTEASLKTWSEGQSALINVARVLKTDTTFQAALESLFQQAIKNGLENHDISALVNVFKSV